MNYIETPFNYTGSKFKLLEQLLPVFDYSKPYFIDVFTGGGSIYTNIVDKYDKIIVNDIIEDLIGIHKGLIESNDIVELTKSLCPGKKNPQGYSILRDSYNQENSPEKLWALMLSCTNNMMRFNQKFKFNQTYGDRGFSDSTQKKVNNFTEHIRKFKDKLVYLSTQFENIEIVKPIDDLLNRFHNNVKNNFELILNLQNQNQLLKEARDILLPRLMGGIIDVEEM